MRQGVRLALGLPAAMVIALVVLPAADANVPLAWLLIAEKGELHLALASMCLRQADGT